MPRQGSTDSLMPCRIEGEIPFPGNGDRRSQSPSSNSHRAEGSPSSWLPTPRADGYARSPRLAGGRCLAAFGACTWSKAGPFERSVPICVRLLSKALLNRFAAFGAGAGLTALLQSSTATGLMTASFAAEGVVGLVPALAISEQDSAGRKRAAAIR
jgi:Na+/Pi-cotransporter